MGMFEERIFKAQGIAGPRALWQGTPDVLEDQQRAPSGASRAGEEDVVGRHLV